MVANIIIGGLVFGYAGWALWRHIKRSKEGKCSSCSVKGTCPGSTCIGSVSDSDSDSNKSNNGSCCS